MAVTEGESLVLAAQIDALITADAAARSTTTNDPAAPGAPLREILHEVRSAREIASLLSSESQRACARGSAAIQEADSVSAPLSGCVDGVKACEIDVVLNDVERTCTRWLAGKAWARMHPAAGGRSKVQPFFTRSRKLRLKRMRYSAGLR